LFGFKINVTELNAIVQHAPSGYGNTAASSCEFTETVMNLA